MLRSIGTRETGTGASAFCDTTLLAFVFSRALSTRQAAGDAKRVPYEEEAR